MRTLKNDKKTLLIHTKLKKNNYDKKYRNQSKRLRFRSKKYKHIYHQVGLLIDKVVNHIEK